jgi:type VI protein secretion system component VasK
MDSTLAFSFVLLAISAGLIISQRRAWRVVVESQRSAKEREFALRQIQRRMQMGTLVGVLAIAIMAGDWITSLAWALAFWSMIALLVLWVVLLAVADLRATRRHFGQLLRANRAEEIRWQTEALRHKEEYRNGTAGHSGDPASGKSV